MKVKVKKFSDAAILPCYAHDGGDAAMDLYCVDYEHDQYNNIVKMYESYGVQVVCIEKADVSEEEELVNDIMMHMASFSGKLYGKRSAKRRKENNNLNKE